MRHPWIIARPRRHQMSTVHFYMSTLHRWSESLYSGAVTLGLAPRRPSRIPSMLDVSSVT